MHRVGHRLAPVSRFVTVVTAIVVIGVATIVAAAAPAAAHALRVGSSPAAGAELATAPSVVTVTFGEKPDPHLSTLRVLDSSGHFQTRGRTEPVPGQPLALQVHLGPLGDGVYTVVWTTVSEVDGHLASGSFAFGIGVAPSGPTATQATTRSPSPPLAATIGRWFLYAGLMLLVGGAAIGLSCFDQPPRLSWPLLSVVAWAAAVGGAVAIALGEATADHVSLGDFAGSTLGHQLAVRLVPLVVGAVVVALPWLRPRRRAVAVLGVAGLVAMWGDVTLSHADAATRDEALKLVVQWLHFAAAGIWIGGLVTLLVGLGALTAADRGRATRRFSGIALVSVVVLAGSGVLRAIDEVGTWHALTSTTFGQAILVKSGLLLVLVGLGAANRYRTVPAVERSPRPLLTIGRVELGLAAIVLVATAVLQGQAPPASVAAAAGPPPLVVSGHDFDTTVRARLAVTPGMAGFNQFDAAVTDYDTGRPVRAAVSLSFSQPDRPDLGSSTLPLRRAADGSYEATGANLSIDGTWDVTVLIQQARSAVDVDLRLTTRPTPEHITVEASPGIPDLYTISLAGDDSVQVYLDPGKSGFNEFHATYIGPDGGELPMRSFTVTASRSGATATALPVRRLDTIGHFVADLSGARAGRYRFDLSGLTTSGITYRSDVTIPVR